MSSIPANVPGGIEEPAIVKAVEEYERLREAEAAARQEFDVARVAAAETQGQNVRAAAEAIRSGGRQPDTKNEAAARKKVETAERALQATELAVRAAGADLEAAIEANRRRYGAELAKRLEQNRVRCTEIVAQLKETVSEAEQIVLLRRWTQDPTNPRRGYAYGVHGEIAALELRFSPFEEQVAAAKAALVDFSAPRDQMIAGIRPEMLFGWLVERGWQHRVAGPAAEQYHAELEAKKQARQRQRMAAA